MIFFLKICKKKKNAQIVEVDYKLNLLIKLCIFLTLQLTVLYRPGHCAAAKGSRPAIKMLQSHNADLWTPNNKGERPLHEAALAKETGQCEDIGQSIYKNETSPYFTLTLQNKFTKMK